MWKQKVKELMEKEASGRDFVSGMFDTIGTTYERDDESDNESDVDDEYLDMFSTGFMGMFTVLLSKDFLYPPLKVLNDAYPGWLAENKGKVPVSDYDRYTRQYDALRKVCDAYEHDDDAADPEERTLDMIELLEGLGGNGEPPEELQAKQAAVKMNLQLINKTLPEDVRNEECSIL
ncbi:peroxisomal biogenesis factor 19-like [Ptychodera flava]|uniref:peroxisomal biogenesis factor 19-like n=1 Tax=Ptychodera flava TaxID=63121 RepID=UPI00396A823D